MKVRTFTIDFMEIKCVIRECYKNCKPKNWTT